MVSARPPFATVLEFRGKVFSGGGDDGEYTIANFLRTYSKHVTGSPSGVTLPLGNQTTFQRCVLFLSVKTRGSLTYANAFLFILVLAAHGKGLNTAVRKEKHEPQLLVVQL